MTWLRIALVVLWERLVGIACFRCGDTAHLPAPGWVHGPVTHTKAAWLCPACSEMLGVPT